MVTFAVPEFQSVAHFALGVLLDRARLDRTGCDGQHQLTVSLMRDDVALLQEMGVVQGDCDPLKTADARETAEQTAFCEEFEKELADLQRKLEAGLAKARMPSSELSSDLA
ncbi:MAG: hypothetical protein ACR2QH_09925 [Geminicoccaceae bacterium]